MRVVSLRVVEGCFEVVECCFEVLSCYLKSVLRLFELFEGCFEG